MTSEEGSEKAMDKDSSWNSFNPMSEAFDNASFNSYLRGPGSTISTSSQVKKRSSGGDSCQFKLHVSNLPPALNKNAIKYLFSNYGVAKNVHVGQAADRPTNWAFVELENMHQVKNAIDSLHKAPPHFLNVKLARSSMDKIDKMSPGNNEVVKLEIPADEPLIKIPASSRSGRGRYLPMFGRSPKSFNAIRPQVENYYDVKQKNDYKEEKFNLYDAPESVVIANEVTGTSLKPVKSRGGIGRGLSCSSIFKRNPTEMTENWVDSMILYNEQDEEDVYGPGVDLSFSPGKCQYCHKHAIKTCSRCKAWYCTHACIKADWPKHKLVCKPRTAEFGHDGHIIYTRDKTRNQTRSKDPNRFRPEDKKEDLNDSSSTVLSTSTSRKRNNSNSSPKNRFAASNKENRNALRKPDVFIQKTEYIEQSKESVPPFPSDKSTKSKESVPPILTDKSTKSKECVPPIPTDKSTKSKQSVPPIPTDKFTEVAVTLVEQPYFWVFNVENCQLLSDIAQKLQEHCNDPRVLPDPTLKQKCCALHQGDWYRAKILSKTDTAAKVFYVDFGNEDTVNLDEIKPLPQELKSIKPQAYKIKFVEGTKTDFDPDTESCYNIKAIKMDDGVCICMLEGGPEMIDEPKPLEMIDEPKPLEIIDEPKPLEMIDEPKPLEMPLPLDQFVSVNVLLPIKDDEYWVIIEDKLSELSVLITTLNSCEKSGSIIDPELNELYMAQYEELWWRVKVTQVEPLMLLFIDYGNSELSKVEDLRQLPANVRDIPPMAINIKLAEGTPQEYFKLGPSDNCLKVKAVKPSDGPIIVHIEGVEYPEEDEDEIQPRLPNLDLPGQKKDNHVAYLINDNATGVVIQVHNALGLNCFTGAVVLTRDKPSESIYKTNEQITKALANIKPDPTFKPSLGDPVCAWFGQLWYRGYIMVKRNDEIKVALVDFGLVLTPEAIAPMPQDLAFIPKAGIRCILTTPVSEISKLKGLEQYSLTSIKKENTKLHGHLESYGEVTISPWEPIYEDGELAAFKLESGMSVQISSFHAPNAVYLRSTESKDLEKFSELVQDIGRYSLTAPPLTRDPLCGELVICKFQEDQMYYRAQVFKKIDEDYQVIFVDYGNTERVSVSDMRLLTDSFKAVPCFAVKVGLKGVPGSAFCRLAVHIMNCKLQDNLNLVVTFEKNHLHEVNLYDGLHLLNSVLAQIMTPSWLDKDQSGESINFQLTDVEYEQWLPGEKLSLILVEFLSYNVALISKKDSPVFAHALKVLPDQLNEYCEQNHSSYNPRVGEICLALFKDGNENTWCRALCTKSHGQSVSIGFIDYGNRGIIEIKNIRKIPPEFMEPPAAINMCKIYGLVSTWPKDVLKEIEIELVQDDNLEGYCINTDSEHHPLIYIPKVNEILAKNGLPPINPPPMPSAPPS